MANIMNYLDWLPLLTNYWRGCFLFVETHVSKYIIQ